MINEAKARGLQQMFQGGATGALQPLYEECVGIAYQIAKRKVRKLNGEAAAFNRDRLIDIAHGASIRLIERYLKDSSFPCRSFTRYLDYKVSAEMFISPKQKQKTFEDKIEYKLDIVAPAGMSITDVITTDLVLEIANSDPWGKKAIADLCRSRSYRQAVRRIAVYVQRRWIYDHAEALHQIYRTLHRGGSSKGKVGGIRGGGLVAVRKRILQGKRDQQEQADKRPVENVER
jgi:hypothetical protein